MIGEEVVRSSYTSYTTNKENEVERKEKDVFARKISLLQIRKQLLEKHERMGLIRDYPDSHFEQLTEEEIKSTLQQLNEGYGPTSTLEELRLKLTAISRRRHFKVWHDHSDVSGHSHFLVLISAVYDPAFYLTSKELENRGIFIDVQTFVEAPEVHILGRSTSSLQDQMMFSECRKQCISELDKKLTTKAGTPITDVLRYFHGDGPAHKFEAGNKIGGNYPCVGCQAKSSCFDDFTHCFCAIILH